MRKSTVSVFMIAGLLSVLLSGCQTRGEPDNVPGTESEAERQISALPYQFARKYGIIKSEDPVYELDSVIEAQMSQKVMKASLVFAICKKRELIISIVLDDDSEIPKAAEGGESPADGMLLTGPGIPDTGIKPQESLFLTDSAYFTAYGHKRYIIEARFELPSDYEDHMSGYALRLPDFEQSLEFSLKRAPEYGTLEELAAEEKGEMDTHDGISIISMGERVKEGVLVSWYVYSETGARPLSIIYKPPFQEINLPTISGENKAYPVKQLSYNPYWDSSGHYRLPEVECYGPRIRCMFDVPQKEQGPLKMNIPGITFLNREESPLITLQIPEDYEELNIDIPWKEGSVRILGITRMKEPQMAVTDDGKGETKVRERPAVYIDVRAVHEDKNLALKGLICERKLKWTGWEHERYDFDGEGNLSGFRIFYEEGDEEVTLRFSGAAFYWNQPFVMGLKLPD